MPLAPGVRLGPYEVIRPHRQRAVWARYIARRDTNLKRHVAIKVLPDALAGDADRLARFRREAQVLASLNHPNIAPHLRLREQADGTHALVMELVEGVDARRT